MSPLDFQAEVFRQFAFISSLLAGFSFAIVFQLLVSNDKRNRASWMIGILLLASSCLIASTFISSLVVFSSSGPNAEPDYLNAVRTVAMIGKSLLYIGFISFLIGVGMSGWLYSRKIGIISTIVTVVCAVFIFVAIQMLMRDFT